MRDTNNFELNGVKKTRTWIELKLFSQMKVISNVLETKSHSGQNINFLFLSQNTNKKPWFGEASVFEEQPNLQSLGHVNSESCKAILQDCLLPQVRE